MEFWQIGICFTIIFCMGICLIVLVLKISRMYSAEETDSLLLNEKLFNMVRKIQLAECVKVSDDGKSLEIEQREDNSFPLVYSFREDIPCGYMELNGGKLFPVKYNACCFQRENEDIIAQIALIINEKKVPETVRTIQLKIAPAMRFVSKTTRGCGDSLYISNRAL